MSITVQRLAYVPNKMKRTQSGTSYTTEYLVCYKGDSCVGVETMLTAADKIPKMGDIYNPYQVPTNDPSFQCEYNEYSYVTSVEVEPLDITFVKQEFGTEKLEYHSPLFIQDAISSAKFAWLVTVEHTPSRGCNPALWCPDVNFSSIIRDAPLTDVVYEGYYETDVRVCSTGKTPPQFKALSLTNDCFDLKQGGCYLNPVNVIGERMVDGPTMPISDFEMTISFWRLGLTDTAPYDFAGHCNATPVRVKLPCRGVDICFEPRTLLCTSIDLDGDEMIDCATPSGEPLRFFNVTYGFLYRTKTFIWDLANEGYHECVRTSPGASGHTVEEIKDGDGNTTSVPRPLDTSGEERRPGGTLEDPKRTILRYSKTCKDFYDIKFGLFPGILARTPYPKGCRPPIPGKKLQDISPY